MNTKEIESLNQIGGERLSKVLLSQFSILTLSMFCTCAVKSGRWHLLELISDGKDEGDCSLCHKSGLGPTYKCKEREDCDFLLHKSCVEQPPHIPDMKHEHDLQRRQHIMFIKELENEEKVICSFCEEPVLGSAYKCSFPTCTFLIHQSCANLPLVLDNHPTDTNHYLDLQESQIEDQYCDLCGKLISGCFSYRCWLCYLAIHVKCACCGLVDVGNCHQHEFRPFHKNVGQLACHACGFQNIELTYLCRHCGLLIHRRCAKMYLHNIKTKECNHYLTCSFSLHPRDFKCRVCKDLIDKRYAAYICDICDYGVHLECAYRILEKKTSIQVREKHFSHPEHNLILSHEQLEYDQHCKVCMDQIISPPFYDCAPCEFFLHEKCVDLPLKIQKPVNHWHPLTLNRIEPSRGEMCELCFQECFGFTYHCDRCPRRIWDIECGLLQQVLKHEGHQHNLFDTDLGGNCNSCGKDMDWQYRCAMCNFNLCYECATYPLQVRHKNDEHPLNLTYKIEDNSRDYYCLICEQVRKSSDWFYYCKQCDFATHITCVYLRISSID